MDRKVAELAAEFDQIPDWDRLPEKTIRWEQAAKMLLEENLEYRRGIEAVASAERSVSRILLDMIPGVNLDAILTKDLEDLQNIGGDDVEFRTNILFNFPSLTKVPLDYYTAKASVFTAKKTLELKQRELFSKLYKSAKEFEVAFELYELQKKSLSRADKAGELDQIQKDWDEKKLALSMETSKLLGDMNTRWRLVSGSIPKLNWQRYDQAVKKLDFLVVMMMAMELEASRLNVLGVKMQYFPELNVNFYSPSLFTSTAGTYSGIFSSSGDIRVDLNLSWRLDTQLRIWHQLKAAKAEHRFLIEEVRMRAIERKEKIKSLVKSRRDFLVWYNYKRKRLDYLLSRTPLGVDDYKQTRMEINEITRDLMSKAMSNVEVEASLILEYGFL